MDFGILYFIFVTEFLTVDVYPIEHLLLLLDPLFRQDKVDV